MKRQLIESSEDVLRRPPPKADHRVRYGSEDSQFGDLRLPPGSGPHPLAIVIHGGFWRAAYDLEHLGHLAGALTTEGIATWNIEYRRIGEAGGGWPGTFDDVGRAFAFLRELAELHPIDLSRIVAVGFSAGGHLALWGAARHKVTSSALATVAPIHLTGVVGLAAIGDLVLAAEMNLKGGVVCDLLGGTPAAASDRYAMASPRALLPLGVRQHLIHGTSDSDVPSEFSASYGEHARDLGDPVEVTLLPDAGHLDLIDPCSPAWTTVRAAVLQLLEPRPASGSNVIGGS
jgi:acetyl esterase/lipase